MNRIKPYVIPTEVPFNIIRILANRVIHGLVLVDENADIIFVNHVFEERLSLPDCVGKNYYTVFFHLDEQKESDQERIEKTPLWRALKTGENPYKKPPYPLVGIGKMAYQIETYVDRLWRPRKGEIRFVLEFWLRIGNIEVFRDDPSFLAI